jgi:hypothetical protein
MVTTAPAFDFSAVAVTEAELPKSATGRERKHAVNPFTEILAASYEAFTSNGNPGRQITIPGKQAHEAVYLIRQAADDLGIGSRVVLRDSKGNTVATKDAKDIRGNVVVLFGAKNRKQRKDAVNGDAPAETDEGTDES